MNSPIGIVGAGRMGRGIALSYAFAGLPVVLVDIKERNTAERAKLAESVFEELRGDLAFLVETHLMEEAGMSLVLDRVRVTHGKEEKEQLREFGIVFEAVPEVMENKASAFSFISDNMDEKAIVASTTSTFLVTELETLITNPTRFMNAHWLNPAHLMPLVEVSKGDQTSQQSVTEMLASLESIGKVPVVCSASPGYIVPRIQARCG
jgi:3-hydroxybutyryl-CoA dehydrogenase